MRTSEGHGNTKSLGRANSNICPHLARWLNSSQREEIGNDCHIDLVFLEFSSDRSNVVDSTKVIWVLDHVSTELICLRPVEVSWIINHKFNANTVSLCLNDFDILREDAL